MIYYTSRNRWKLRRMQSAFFVVLKNGHLLHLRYPFLVYIIDSVLLFLELNFKHFLCHSYLKSLTLACCYCHFLILVIVLSFNAKGKSCPSAVKNCKLWLFFILISSAVQYIIYALCHPNLVALHAFVHIFPSVSI